MDERVTLVGYTYDTDYAKNAPQFDESGKLLSDHEGEIVQGISGEAVRILKKPGKLPVLLCVWSLLIRLSDCCQ